MRRLSFVICLLLSPAAWGKEPAAVQFLDKTYVEAPKTAGPFTLVGTSYEAKTFYSGVTTEWKSPQSTPSLKINVFVYPQGRADEAEAVAAAMSEVEASVAEAEKRGIYANTKLGKRAPFMVVRAESWVSDDDKKAKPAFDPTPKPETRLEASVDSKDPLAKVFAESQPSANNHGLHESITFDRDGGSWRSAAFVFYRHLFLFKVRISVPVEEMSQEAFDRLAESAAREVVPRIQVQNFGTCGNIEIATPAAGSRKNKTDQDAGEELIRGIARVGYENCANSPGEKDEVPAGFERVVIEYPPNTWKSGN